MFGVEQYRSFIRNLIVYRLHYENSDNTHALFVTEGEDNTLFSCLGDLNFLFIHGLSDWDFQKYQVSFLPTYS